MKNIQRRLRRLALTGRGEKEEIFNDIYRLYARKIRGFIALRLPNYPDDCDDLTQITLLKVYRHLHEYKPLFTMNTWIYTIANRTLIDFVRKESKKGDCPQHPSSSIDDAVSPYTDPVDTLIDAETVQSVRYCLESLDWQDRQIAYLRFYECLKIKNIAGILGKPQGTVKYRIYRIRRQLKKKLEEKYG